MILFAVEGESISVMSGSDDMMLNGDDRAVEAIPQPVVGTTEVVQPSSVAEPKDRLIPQSPSPMPVAGASGGGVAQGDTIPIMPVLHLHRHKHVEGIVDEEARAIVERLAAQHREFFCVFA